MVRFGATVELADEDDARRTLTLVGDDEAEAGAGRIAWGSPMARALVGARVGDERTVRLPAGEKSWEVMAISYPPLGAPTAAEVPVGPTLTQTGSRRRYTHLEPIRNTDNPMRLGERRCPPWRIGGPMRAADPSPVSRTGE